VGEDAERVFPDQLALEVVAEQAWGAEEGVHQRPVRGTRGRGVAVPGVRLARLDAARRQPLPQELAVARPDAENMALVAAGIGGGQEKAVAPDDRRRIALAGQCRLPEQVVPITPGERHARVLGVSLAAGPAPLRPVRG